MSTVVATKMRAFAVSSPGKLEGLERDIPRPGPGQVRVRVEACGICHSDVLTVQGIWPGIRLPRVPGHEIAGVVDAIGADVPEWKPGDRAGIGWYGGSCGHCDRCRRGDPLTCRTDFQVTGIHFDGGYADYVVAPWQVLARIPDGMSAEEAAPLMDAGVTTFNPLRHSGAMPGDVVAILGIGGLGHLGIQFAAKMGFDTIAIGRGADKSPLARELGARIYIDNKTQDPVAELQKLGGAKVILATATQADAMAAVIPGLGPEGRLIVCGAPAEPMSVSALPLIMGRRSISGWPSGTSLDSQECLRFAKQMGVKPRIELFHLDEAPAAYDRMMSGEARFRVVMTTS